MRCVIQPHHGGLGQLGDWDSLPIVHTCHTHTHSLDRKQALPQQSPICCNICQRNVKMSVNWGYFLHLPFTISHLLSSHPRMWWGSIYTRFYGWGSSQRTYAGATRDVSRGQKARITFLFLHSLSFSWHSSPIENMGKTANENFWSWPIQ